MNNVEPRFRPVSPETMYDEKLKYGWEQDGRRRQAGALALTPDLEVRGVARDPLNLPRDVLFKDYIRGEGDQVFIVKAPPGTYNVTLLDPDRNGRTETIEPIDGFLRIRFPRGGWIVSALVVKGPSSRLEPPALQIPPQMPRPSISHAPPRFAEAGQPLTLSIEVSGIAAPMIRLHYRALNQNDQFRTVEGRGPFIIPGDDISARWDLDVQPRGAERRGIRVVLPDPRVTTPYIVVPTRR